MEVAWDAQQSLGAIRINIGIEKLPIFPNNPMQPIGSKANLIRAQFFFGAKPIGAQSDDSALACIYFYVKMGTEGQFL